MTDEELAAIEARAKAATAGPWAWVEPEASVHLHEADEMPSLASAVGEVCNFGNGMQYYPTEGSPPSQEDAAFIAAARTDVPALVAEVRRLREVEAELASMKASIHAGAYDTSWGNY